MIAQIARTFVRFLLSRHLLTIAAALGGLSLTLSSPASAVSSSVRNACMGDYFAYCAGMEVGSAELRRCFNRNGAKLSSGCVSALVAAGEVSKAEVSRRSGSAKKVASPKPRKAIRTASRNQCVAGPARPGASAIVSCRGSAVAAASKRKQLATLR